MTTKAQDAIIDGMADDGAVFVKPLRILGREYSAVAACVLDDDNGRRIGPWTLIAEDGAVMTLREESSEDGWLWGARTNIPSSTEEMT